MSRSEWSSVSSEVVFVEDILKDLQSGRVRIPKFQRPFEWSPKQMTHLLDSIQNGYPIGSLLYWKTESPIKSIETIGTTTVPDRPDGEVSYVLDGHQRLSTLFGVLMLDPIFPLDKNSWYWRVYFDLNESSFVQTKKGEIQPEFLPMNSILKTTAFLKECRRIAVHFDPDSGKLIDLAEQCAQRFTKYKLPVITVRGDIEKAVETFTRLNTTGRAVSVDQMVSALTYREGESSFHLESKIDEIIESLASYSFDSISRRTVFRAIVAALLLDIYKTDWKKIRDVVGEEIAFSAEEVRQSLIRAAEFMKDELGVASSKLIPYEHQMIMLSEFFRICSEPSVEDTDQIRTWFYSTTYSGWFAGLSDTQMNKALDLVRAYASRDTAKFSPTIDYKFDAIFPEHFNSRGASSRALLLYMQTLKPRDLWSGEELPIKEILEDKGATAFARISTRVGRETGNRILISPKTKTSEIEARLFELDNDNEDHRRILVSHAIDSELLSFWKTQQLGEFAKIRAMKIARMESEFLTTCGLEVNFDIVDHETDAEMLF